jgi:hypothetical protein
MTISERESFSTGRRKYGDGSGRPGNNMLPQGRLDDEESHDIEQDFGLQHRFDFAHPRAKLYRRPRGHHHPRKSQRPQC